MISYVFTEWLCPYCLLKKCNATALLLARVLQWREFFSRLKSSYHQKACVAFFLFRQRSLVFAAFVDFIFYLFFAYLGSDLAGHTRQIQIKKQSFSALPEFVLLGH